MGKKVVYDKHENTYFDMEEKLSRKLGKTLGTIFARIITDYEKKCIQKCDAFIYATPQNEITDLKCESALIPNFPKLTEDDYSETNLYENMNDSTFRLCFCGGIAPIWSILEICKIINNGLPEDIKFELAGGCNSNYLELIKKADQNSKCNYHGVVPYEEVGEIYKDGHVGMALLKKNLGGNFNREGTLANTKIYEFMKQGLPVIFTDFTIWKEMWEQYKFGIPVDPSDFKQIEDAIIFLYNNREEAKNMGAEGKKAIIEKYNWQMSEKEFIKLYKSILSGG